MRSFGFSEPHAWFDDSRPMQTRLVFQIGVAPVRIDILTEISGITFEEAWPNRTFVSWDGLEVPMIHRKDLIRNKKATGRLKDLADVEVLERR